MKNFGILTCLSRREFLRQSVRSACVTAGVAFSAWQVRKGAALQSCVNRSVCDGCIAFDECTLPPALAFSQNQATRSAL